jgi:hypothetical protein
MWVVVVVVVVAAAVVVVAVPSMLTSLGAMLMNSFFDILRQFSFRQRTTLQNFFFLRH